jgi:hypothetical protein
MKSQWVVVIFGFCLTALTAIVSCESGSGSTRLGEHAVGRSAAADLGASCPAGAINVLAAPSLVGYGQTVEATCAGSSDATLVPASSFEAEEALTTLNASGLPTQRIAPMVRALSTTAVCGTQVGSPSTAASMAVALDAVTLTSRAEDSLGGGAAGCTLAYSSNAAAPKVIPTPTPTCPDCQYTIDPGDWRDVLRILYAGVHKDGRKDCNSLERQALANNWQTLFESTCGAECTQITHLFRPGDFSDATDVFLAALGLPPASENPFCNGWNAPFAKTGDADYVDADPIRRPCTPVRFAEEGDGDQVCNVDNALGLLLPIVVPQPSPTSAWAQDPSQVYPTTLCAGYYLQPPLPGGNCPDGTPPLAGGMCWVPLGFNPDGSDNYACIQPGKDPNAFEPPNGVDDRVFNLQLRAPDGTIRLDERGRPIVGAFYRLRTFAAGHVFAAGNPAVSCASPSSDGQMACLSTDVPCSLGMRMYSTTVSAPSPVVQVAGMTAGTQSIQNLVNAPAQAYPLAHRVYLNTVLGLNGLAGPEERLGTCWTRPSLARSAALQNDLVELPGGPACEDFDETACGAASNVDACASSVPSCTVDASKELMITDLSVVEDPIRTGFLPQYAGDPRQGAFTIKRIFERISPTPHDAAANLETFFEDFFVLSVAMQTQPSGAIAMPPLPRDAAGNVDLENAPFRLLAITSRIDLRNLPQNSAGEARFTFGITNPDGTSFGGGAPSNDQNSLTVIFEFTLPAQSEADALAWAQAWHALGALPRPSGPYSDANEPYNAALQALTDRFTAPGAIPSRPNGSALNAVRTRDTDEEMREFILCPKSVPSPAPGGCTFTLQAPPPTPAVTKTYPLGWLVPNPVSRTPMFNADRKALGLWINNHADAVRAQDYELQSSCPLDASNTPITTADCAQRDMYADLVAATDAWNPNISDRELRHTFAINTCNGCHLSETGANQFQIAMRSAGAPSSLAIFLTGTAKQVATQDFNTNFPRDLTPRHFNELERRAADLRNVVCPLPCSTGAAMPDGVHTVH